MLHFQAASFSPFSPSSVRQESQRSLLLQFFLKEILSAHQAILDKTPHHLVISFDWRHFPYDWAHEAGHVNKAREHAQLFSSAFQGFEYENDLIHKLLNDLILSFSGKDSLSSHQKFQIKKKLRQLYLLSEPLVRYCKNSEKLMFFLLKNENLVNALLGKGYLYTFLSHLHKNGLGELEKTLCDHYHNRGFASLVSELKKRFAKIDR